MSEIKDFYWTIEEMFNSGLKLVTYRDARNGDLLGTWLTNRGRDEIEAEIRANRKALMGAFNGNTEALNKFPPRTGGTEG